MTCSNLADLLIALLCVGVASGRSGGPAAGKPGKDGKGTSGKKKKTTESGERKKSKVKWVALAAVATSLDVSC